MDESEALKNYWIEIDEPLDKSVLNFVEKAKINVLDDFCVGLEKSVCPDKWLCQVCGKLLKDRSSLLAHLRNHSGIKKYSCTFCPKSFAYGSILKNHLRTHTGERPYICIVCNKKFKTRSVLDRHKLQHNSSLAFECFTCSKIFKHKIGLNNHLKLHSKGPFVCKICEKVFDRQRALSVHKLSHSRYTGLTCNLCDKLFKGLDVLKRHMATAHMIGKTSKYKCNKCDVAYDWRSSLAAHVKSHVSSSLPCPQCRKDFVYPKSLQSHLTRHANPKPHKCHICGRMFVHRYRLRAHFQCHQKLPCQFKCAKCVCVFPSLQKLKIHSVSHKSH